MGELAAAEVRARREALGLTQAALAAALGVTANAVARWERGERTIRQAELVRRALDDLERASVQRRDAGPAPATSLPLQAGRLIDRRQELQAIHHLLLGEAVRLLTLVGPGGTGKTRLAVEAADRLRTRLPHGVVFVDLSPLTDPARVARSIVEALGAREVEGVPLPETLRGALSGREVLLVLDNCEHVLAGLAVVSDLLGACPAARVLATSREPLRLRWERTFAVPPLAYPDLQAVPDLATLAEIPAGGIPAGGCAA